MAESCRWEHCTVGQIASYVQQLVPDLFLFQCIITTNVLSDDNMVYKICCKTVSAISPLHTIQHLKQQRETFTLRRIHTCHPNRLSGTICIPQ